MNVEISSFGKVNAKFLHPISSTQGNAFRLTGSQADVIGPVRSINILTWLRGFLENFYIWWYFINVCVSWDLRDKET